MSKKAWKVSTNGFLLLLVLATLAVWIAVVFDYAHHLTVMAGIGGLSLVSCPLIALLFMLSGGEDVGAKIMFILLIASLIGIAIGAVAVLSMIPLLILRLA